MKNKNKQIKRAVRVVQIEQGAYDGRFAPKVYDNKKKKIKNGYIKHKKEYRWKK